MMGMNILRVLAEVAGGNVDHVDLPCAGGGCNQDGSGLVMGVLGAAYLIIGVVAVIIIIIAGFQYMTSEGEPEKAKRAQMTITYTVIGLIVATVAAAIVGFVTGAFS